MGVLLDHAQDKVVLINEEGEVTYANEAVERILDWKPAELVGDIVFDYIHSEDVEKVRAACEETMTATTYTETTCQYRFRARDDSWVWLESRMSNVTAEGLDGYVVSSRDITDRIEAQRESRELTARLKELSNTTGEVLWMFNSDWSELLFVNPSYEAVYGQPIDELEADPSAFLDAIHPNDVPAVEEAMNRLAKGNPVDIEYRVNPDEDYRVWVWVQAEPIIEDGEVVRLTGFSRDITDRYRRERQLYVMDNLLRHNIRNDMTVILGNAKMIEKKTPEAADRVAVIRRTGENLLASAEKERKIIDIMTSSVRRQSLNLEEVILDSVEVVRERYPAARFDVSHVSGTAVCALDDLQVGVVELLENAACHSERDDPSISIATHRTEDNVNLVVKSDPPPIPDIEAQVLTGNHELNDIYHSGGLGLWLIYWVVELSDGHIEVSTDPDKGNRIQLALPRE